MEAGAGLLVGLEVVFGEDDGLAGEAVAEGVEGGSALAFGGDGASGAGGVLAVGGGAFVCQRRG